MMVSSRAYVAFRARICGPHVTRIGCPNRPSAVRDRLIFGVRREERNLPSDLYLPAVLKPTLFCIFFGVGRLLSVQCSIATDISVSPPIHPEPSTRFQIHGGRRRHASVVRSSGRVRPQDRMSSVATGGSYAIYRAASRFFQEEIDPIRRSDLTNTYPRQPLAVRNGRTRTASCPWIPGAIWSRSFQDGNQ